MGHACCTHREFSRRPDEKDHPVTAVLAIVAIVAAVLLIALARVALVGEGLTVAAEDQAAASRWATGFSH
jgi:hypothetical protein